MAEMINMDRDIILLCSALSEGSEVDGVEYGGAEGVCHETAGRSGGHRSRQEAQSGPSHPLFGTRYEYSTYNIKQVKSVIFLFLNGLSRVFTKSVKHKVHV